MITHNPFVLLKQRRFLPLFCTRFLGAFNDSVFKNALIILFAFSTTKTFLNLNTLVNLCALLFQAFDKISTNNKNIKVDMPESAWMNLSSYQNENSFLS